MARREALAPTPPAYPDREPSEPTTRWHGTSSETGLEAQAEATALTASGLPVAEARAE